MSLNCSSCLNTIIKECLRLSCMHILCPICVDSNIFVPEELRGRQTHLRIHCPIKVCQKLSKMEIDSKSGTLPFMREDEIAKFIEAKSSRNSVSPKNEKLLLGNYYLNGARKVSSAVEKLSSNRIVSKSMTNAREIMNREGGINMNRRSSMSEEENGDIDGRRIMVEELPKNVFRSFLKRREEDDKKSDDFKKNLQLALPETQEKEGNIRDKRSKDVNHLYETPFIKALREKMTTINDCVDHKKEFNLFCLTEKEFCCIECVHKDSAHNNHKVISLTSIIGKLKEELLDFRKEALLMGKSCKEILTMTERAEKSLVKQMDDYKIRVAKVYSDIYKALEKSERKLINDIEYIMGDQVREACVRKENISYLEQNIREFCDTTFLFELIDQNVVSQSISLGILKQSFLEIKSDANAFFARDSSLRLDFTDVDNLLNSIHNISRTPIEEALSRVRRDKERSLISGKGNLSGLPDLGAKSNKNKIYKKLLKDPRHRENFKSLDGTKRFDLRPISPNKSKTISETKRLVFIKNNLDPDRPTYAPFEGSLILNNSDLITGVKNFIPFEIASTQLLYRLSVDGASSEKFHQKCDNLGPYLIICQANDNHLFGAFCTVPFIRKDKYQSCSDTFLFSLHSKAGFIPRKFPIKQEKKFLALFQSERSPCFGTTIVGRHDLWINFDDLEKSCSNLGYAYDTQELKNTAGSGTTILAGRYSNWDFKELEILNLSF